MFKSIVSVLSHFHRGLIISGGFALFMLAGALMLMLPVSQTGNGNVSFVDAFFTAVSAVSVTGLSTLDYREDFSVFGQTVILIMSQVGGLGIMTILAVWGISTGRRIRLQERLLIRDSFNLSTPSGMVSLVKKIAVITIAIELVSGILFSIGFAPYYGWWGIYIGFWHAIASFCNTGLDILGPEGGFGSFSMNPYILIVTFLTTELGAVGFIVIDDVISKKNWQHLTLNSKITLSTGLMLVLFGAAALFFMEGNNPGTMGNETTGWKLLHSFFMSSSARTSGFSVFSMDALESATALLMMALMVIGSGPVSTGGGIRTTTFAILFLSVFNWIRGRQHVVVFHKRIADQVLFKALNIFCLHMGLIVLTAFLLLMFDTGNYGFKEILFESISAFSTVGFSMGITSGLNDICKIVLALAMFIGRIGVMTLVITFGDRKPRHLIYPVENVTIG
jgi:trk system potassium uptake protein TrkH